MTSPPAGSPSIRDMSHKPYAAILLVGNFSFRARHSRGYKVAHRIPISSGRAVRSVPRSALKRHSLGRAAIASVMAAVNARATPEAAY